jgi:thioredoxin 1
MPTVHVSDESFERLVLRSEKPVLVDFWAPWCAPCRQVAPALEELSNEMAAKLTIAKVNVDDSPRVASRFRIQSIPTMVLFAEGQPVQAVAGARPKAQIKALLEQWLPSAAGPVVTVDELDALLNSRARVQIFDLRRTLDFERSHLRGARCVAPESLEEEIAKLPRGTISILIDRTGDGSLQRAEQLVKQGLPVRALAKGLLEWEGSGRPTYSNKEEAALEASRN